MPPCALGRAARKPCGAQALQDRCRSLSQCSSYDETNDPSCRASVVPEDTLGHLASASWLKDRGHYAHFALQVNSLAYSSAGGGTQYRDRHPAMLPCGSRSETGPCRPADRRNFQRPMVFDTSRVRRELRGSGRCQNTWRESSIRLNRYSRESFRAPNRPRQSRSRGIHLACRLEAPRRGRQVCRGRARRDPAGAPARGEGQSRRRWNYGIFRISVLRDDAEGSGASFSLSCSTIETISLITGVMRRYRLFGEAYIGRTIVAGL
jgi:hypothetical protein